MNLIVSLSQISRRWRLGARCYGAEEGRRRSTRGGAVESRGGRATAEEGPAAPFGGMLAHCVDPTAGDLAPVGESGVVLIVGPSFGPARSIFV
jgi:hypothetical protein